MRMRWSWYRSASVRGVPGSGGGRVSRLRSLDNVISTALSPPSPTMRCRVVGPPNRVGADVVVPPNLLLTGIVTGGCRMGP